MDPELPTSETETTDAPTESTAIKPAIEAISPAPVPASAPPSLVNRTFLGPLGLRAGWSVAIFFGLLAVFGVVYFLVGGLLLHFVLHRSLDAKGGMTPFTAIFSEGLMVLGLISAATLTALIERRRLFDYNLRGPGRVSRFLSGLVAGFAALSALIGGLYLGGWLHFSAPSLHGVGIGHYAAYWAVGFLFVGLFEEGLTRCFLQSTLTRGINFWWALGVVGLMCAILIPKFRNESAWGVWFFAALGLLPCIMLHQKKAARSAFWFAAWVTSTFFGFMHVSNNGENWIGIFAAAAIGFVFCVSVYATGSAWWAIGCHAAWDWAETFFYGTADSGSPAKGHFLTTAPAGSALWSGGADGPEGSLLVLPTIALILVIVLVQYRRRKAAAEPVLEPAA